MDIEEFKRNREALHKKVMDFAGKNMKAFHHLDWKVYEPGALDKKTKQMLGLVASMVLRCDDCIAYHLTRCAEEGVSSGELEEAMTVAVMVGGSIIIPYLRRAVKVWEALGNTVKETEEKK